ncbi:hypothetical protein VTO73DRAFT_11253 [Trametes versicolor]
MAFNSQYDGLNLTPAFTFPEDHSFGNDHSFMTSEDPLAQPRQPNLWTTQDVISFMQAGPSRAPVEHEEGPVTEYTSNSLSPTFDIWADMPAPYTTSQGPLNETSEGLGMGLESFQFGFSAEGGFAASPWDAMYIPSSISAPGVPDTYPPHRNLPKGDEQLTQFHREDDSVAGVNSVSDVSSFSQATSQDPR